ncbi:alcohol dehydrogenase catalytic domain-containing protein [Robertmurraya massiliosenegalensis]|uniref:alcohol dehydrogenase catalytic domain-containing protein n=1 Tax=Robertmurraya massiliosenegalensis TaxID=1287657 RepID=UPI0002FA7A4D|nr:zinc-binding dehydrogenase [Robertmurraya massiliosenegalensis]
MKNRIEEIVERIPQKMKAVVIRQHGGPEVLNIEEMTIPKPGEQEVLIKVEATALNHLDIFAREGLKGPGVPKLTLPHISGVDIVGYVVEYGPNILNSSNKIEKGKRVLVNPSFGCGDCRFCRNGEPSMCPDYKIVGEHLWGGLAEYVVVPAKNIIPIPDHISSERAAAIPAVYTTAWRGVVHVGKIKPSDKVLIIGASGGLGSAQLDIAVAAGATVIGIASSEEKRKRCLEMGAVAMFDSNGDWMSEIKEWSNQEGVDMVFDSVGKPTFTKSLNSLKMGGKLVLSGATAGDFPEISIREIYQWHRQILGAPMGNWDDFLQVTDYVWQEKLNPQVSAVFPLEKIAEAQSLLENRSHFGKIVIRVC